MEYLSEWRGKQRERSRENITVICTWVFRWGWTTNEIIGRLLNLKRPNLADEFCKKGFFSKIQSPPGNREKYVYILTQTGLEIAEMEMDKFHGYIETYPYTLHESRRIPWMMLNHNAICQHVLLDFLGSRPDQISFVTELEYRQSGGGKSDESVPDFSFIKEDKNVLVEIELNHKADLRLKRWLYLRIKDLEKNPDSHLLILTNLNSVISAVDKILKNPRIPEISKGENSGKLYERTDRIGIHLTQDLRDRIEIKMLVSCPSRKSGGFSAIEKEDIWFEDD